MKSSQSRLCETRDKRPLGSDPDRSWCHRYTKSTKKFFWSQPMVPWASAAAYGQGEKFLAQPTTDMKLKTSGALGRDRTGVGITATLV